MKLPVVLIAAVAENNVIGAGGALPWRLKRDLQKFRALTMGKPVIMGRKTLDEIGRVLDGRDVIVVSRNPDLVVEGASVASSLQQALSIAAERAAASGADEICVAGGAEIYVAAMPVADLLRITHIGASPEGDAFFPEISNEEWCVVAREAVPASEGDTVTGEHVVYTKRR